MKKTILLLLVAVVLTGCQSKPTQPQSASPTQDIKSERTVPLPSEKDVINGFFRAINDKRINQALEFMNSAVLGDNSQKQAWEAQFKAMQSVNVVAAEKTLQSEWTDTRRTLTVAIDITMDPSSANAPIPFYGYENGRNIRWITLEKVNKLWKVTSISTGP